MKRRSIIALVALSAALVVAACQTGASASPGSSSGLDGTWQWTASTEKVPANQSVVPNPENYTITFAADGTAAIKADCNNVTATYTVDGSNLTIVLGASTLAACPEGSLDAIYLASLGKVATYAISGSELTLTYAEDAGTMTFTKS